MLNEVNNFKWFSISNRRLQSRTPFAYLCLVGDARRLRSSSCWWSDSWLRPSSNRRAHSPRSIFRFLSCSSLSSRSLEARKSKWIRQLQNEQGSCSCSLNINGHWSNPRSNPRLDWKTTGCEQWILPSFKLFCCRTRERVLSVSPPSLNFW